MTRDDYLSSQVRCPAFWEWAAARGRTSVLDGISKVARVSINGGTPKWMVYNGKYH